MSLGQESDGSLADELPLREGAIYGAAAYVVGYVLTYLLVTLDGEADLSQLSGTDAVSGYQVVGWVFYSAHLVEIEFSGMGMQESANLLSEGSFQFPSVVYYLAPVVAIVGAGYMLVENLDLGDVDTEESAKTGALLVVGYFPLALVGSFLFTVEQTQSMMGQTISISMGPSTTNAVLLVGLLFPLALGVIGGVLHSET